MCSPFQQKHVGINKLIVTVKTKYGYLLCKIELFLFKNQCSFFFSQNELNISRLEGIVTIIWVKCTTNFSMYIYEHHLLHSGRNKYNDFILLI